MFRQILKNRSTASRTAHATSVAADRGTWPRSGDSAATAARYRKRHNPQLQPQPRKLEQRLLSKANTVQLLTQEFHKPGYHPAAITLGHDRDPYQPNGQQLAITRQLLELMLKYRQPVRILTSSHLVIKDLDLLSALAAQRLCTVVMNLNTLSDELKSKMAPRTASPSARLKAIAILSAAGVPVGAMVAPVIPMVNDGEIEAVLSEVAAAGALTADYQCLALPADIEQPYQQWLERHYPAQAERIFNLSQINRSSCATEFARMVDQRFWQTCQLLQLNRTGLPVLDTTRFQIPGG